MSERMLEARALCKVYPMPAGDVIAVEDVSLVLDSGDYVAVTGPSGCGKSTLLHLLGCVDRPTSGRLLLDGRDVVDLPDSGRSRIRLTQIGFVFQRFYLVPMLTAWENIELVQSEAGWDRSARRERTEELLDFVGLSDRAHHRPSQLSGGEMQRVAIARALANRPRLLLADEPTGELDEATGAQIAALFEKVHAEGTAILMVTHDSKLADRAARHLRMRSGRLLEDA